MASKSKQAAQEAARQAASKPQVEYPRATDSTFGLLTIPAQGLTLGVFIDWFLTEPVLEPWQQLGTLILSAPLALSYLFGLLWPPNQHLFTTKQSQQLRIARTVYTLSIGFLVMIGLWMDVIRPAMKPIAVTILGLCSVYLIAQSPGLDGRRRRKIIPPLDPKKVDPLDIR